MNKLTPEQKEKYKLKAREKRAKTKKSTENDIVCRLCNLNVNVKGMPIHLQNVHNQEFINYVEVNLQDFQKFGWKSCKICGKVSNKINVCSMVCNKIWKAMPENISGITPGWNGGLTKEDNESLKKMGESVSRANTGNPKLLGNNNPATRQEVKDKISKTRIERGVAKGVNNPMFGKTHTEESLRKIFDKRSLTTPELKLKQILDKLNISYKIQFFIRTDSRTFSYDFYLPTHNTIIEVDGDYWHGGPRLKKHWFNVQETIKTDKIKNEVAYNAGYKIIRIWESELNADESIVINILSLNGIS